MLQWLYWKSLETEKRILEKLPVLGTECVKTPGIWNLCHGPWSIRSLRKKPIKRVYQEYFSGGSSSVIRDNVITQIWFATMLLHVGVFRFVNGVVSKQRVSTVCTYYPVDVGNRYGRNEVLSHCLSLPLSSWCYREFRRYVITVLRSMSENGRFHLECRFGLQLSRPYISGSGRPPSPRSLVYRCGSCYAVPTY